MIRKCNPALLLFAALLLPTSVQAAHKSQPPHDNLAWLHPGGSGGGPTCSYVGRGDIAPASSYVGLRAYSAATCGQRFANVCDSTGGVDVACADMFTSATTGAVVPLLIGGHTCPDSSGLCTIKTAYDQTLGNNCGGSCDYSGGAVANRYQFLSGAAVCLQAPICMAGGAAAAMFAVSTPASLAQPFALDVVGYWSTFPGPDGTPYTGTSYLLSVGNAAILNNANGQHYYYSCDNVNQGAVVQPLATLFDVGMTCVGGTATFYRDGNAVQTVAGTGSVSGQPFFGYTPTGTYAVVYLEVSFSNTDLTSHVAALAANSCAYWGFTCM